MLSATYSTATRQDLVDIAQATSKTALDFLVANPNESFLIDISGDAGSGKSLFWDVFVREILGQNAIFILKDSVSGESYGRQIETWKGFNDELGRGIKIFLCNVRSSRANASQKYLDTLYAGSHQNLGDIILLTNADKYINLFSKKPHIQISISAAEIEITFSTRPSTPINLEEHPLRWKREIKITYE